MEKRRRFLLLLVGVLLTAAAILLTDTRLAASAGDGRAQIRQSQEETVRIIAERFSFTPSRIRVKQGARLVIVLSSDDTIHGFRIPAAGIDVRIPARGRGELEVELEARERGRYAFECSRACGAGHTLMRGEIIVE